MPLGARGHARREERRERRQDRRQGRSPAAAMAVGAVAGAAVASAAVSNRPSSHSPPPSGHGHHPDEIGGPTTFIMREKLLRFGDDFTINKASRRHERGEPYYYADNKILRVRETFKLQTYERPRRTLYKIQDRMMRLRDSMAIEDDNGNKVAEIKKRKIGVVRDNYVVKIRGDRDWQVHGTILEHDYRINEDGRPIVHVHKNWIAPIRDCYMIDVHSSDEVALALCVCIALDAMD